MIVITENEQVTILISFITLFFAILGGCFALFQWYKSLVYKRIEIINTLIMATRKDEIISTVTDIVDWDEDFKYDGKFHISQNPKHLYLKNLSDEELFNKIDHTLSVFSYICYLKSVKAINSKDMSFFNYNIRRLADNKHISNYLYSLYHWSKSLNVEMSFIHLTDFCIKKKYLRKSFKKLSANDTYYSCYLYIP